VQPIEAGRPRNNSGFQNFFQRMKSDLKIKKPKLSAAQQHDQIGKLWAGLSDDQKA